MSRFTSLKLNWQMLFNYLINKAYVETHWIVSTLYSKDKVKLYDTSRVVEFKKAKP